MPGQFRYPVSGIAAVAAELWKQGVRAILIFGIPKEKDPLAVLPIIRKVLCSRQSEDQSGS